ncbi:MAG: hypothetical protein ACLQVI_10750, partial [Polyangiaceae bacterium]
MAKKTLSILVLLAGLGAHCSPSAAGAVGSDAAASDRGAVVGSERDVVDGGPSAAWPPDARVDGGSESRSDATADGAGGGHEGGPGSAG